MESCSCAGGSQNLIGVSSNSSTGDHYWPYYQRPYCPYCDPPRCPRCGRPLQDCSPWYPAPYPYWYVDYANPPVVFL